MSCWSTAAERTKSKLSTATFLGRAVSTGTIVATSVAVGVVLLGVTLAVGVVALVVGVTRPDEPQVELVASIRL